MSKDFAYEKQKILPIKKQYEVMDMSTKYRLDNILPELMKREGLDMWIILAREYNEDPVFFTLIPGIVRTASRLSCIVFYLRPDNQLESLALCGTNPHLAKFYNQSWNSKSETQWQCIKRIVEERDPNRIGINVSDQFALADGLTKRLHDKLISTLGEEYSKRLVSAEKLCVGWLERRSLPELELYPQIYKVACDIIHEAFSNQVIKPGVTTTQDVEWWIMEKIKDLGLEFWFTPTIDLQRQGVKEKRIMNTVILHGDILHCDVGITYMGLCTDTQKIAYVLKPEEERVPLGLETALKLCNQFQDIVTENFVAGRTGNEIMIASLAEANEQNIKAMLYTHPIGYHGHGAGPTIGLWGNQRQVPGRGDYPMYHDTCYALELNTTSTVPEWDNQEVCIFLEETIAFTKTGVSYLKDRQTKFITIG
ncbi:M24 family metallopeptidase [Sporosalibacterium faouarense]|uniref:M24 family metallopeptidase n=1 Tax=Sporosalibacterium faouarense TaxID=516123 RepID=UPI00192C2086|nr:M24 family metallopeptidase [Sporosalibacterium faouarense]